MINNIQILRGLAALWVVFHHSLGHFKAMGLSFLPFEWLAAYGYVGVDVFFVISGLVMAKTTNDLHTGKRVGLLFLSKRYLRIYAGYWPILILTIMFMLALDPEILMNKNVVGSVFLISTDMFELIIAPSWSLPFELYFYFLIGLLLFFSIKNIHRFFLILILLIIIKLSTIDFGKSLLLDLLFSHMIFEFLFGYYLWLYRDKFISLSAAFWVIVAVVSFFLGGYYELVGTVWRVVSYGVFSLSIVVIALKYEGHLYQGLVKLLKPLGDASYTLYLLHFVMFFIFFQLGIRTFMVNSNFAGIGFVAYILFIVLTSYLLYYFIEKPLYTWCTRNIKPEKV